MTGKKKIGIITFHRSNNYGAMYQSYALSKFLESKGYDVFVLNYHLERATLASYLKRPLSFFGKIISKKAISIRFLKAKTNEMQGKKREATFSAIFDGFRKKHLDITDTTYDYKLLKTGYPEAYAYITGSDQVWSADFVFSSPAYLLGFVPNNIKKISYAPSFGKSALEPYLQSTFKKYIRKFDAISVREKSGAYIVKNIAGLESTWVLDPTLLLQSYDEIIDYSMVPKGDYIFTYRLSQEVKLSTWMHECLKAISSDRDLPIYSVTTNSADGFVNLGTNLQPTPGQMLGLIEKASFFVTNSFHGTVFALLFRTDFLTCARDSFADKQNLRLTELLTSVGLEEFFCEPKLSLREVLAKCNEEYHFTRAHAMLESRRKNSETFLTNALQ